MPIIKVIAQLRTTDLDASIHFYTARLGLKLAFRHQDFYAGIRVGDQLFHLKQVDRKDPGMEFVHENEHFHLYFQTDDAASTAADLKKQGITPERDVHDTAWGTREFVIRDDQGHTLYFGEPSPSAT